MMSKWNLQNPLVKIMVEYYNTLEMDMYDYIKRGIIYTSVSVVMFLITAILLFNDQSSFYLYLIYGALYIYSTTRYTNILLSEIKKNNIKDIIFGKEYELADVNNEKIFSIMCELKELCGRVRTIREMHFLITIIFLISSFMYLLRVFI